MTYTNNSKYAISGFTLTALLKDSNEKTYYSCYDTVLPGETSPNFESFGPKTLNKNDVEFLECQITITDSQGNTQYITYDYKLKSYRVL